MDKAALQRIDAAIAEMANGWTDLASLRDAYWEARSYAVRELAFDEATLRLAKDLVYQLHLVAEAGLVLPKPAEEAWFTLLKHLSAARNIPRD